MGQHKTNPNSIAKAKGELQPKKKEKRLTKKDLHDLMYARIVERINLPKNLLKGE
jgi:hypothetical protein